MEGHGASSYEEVYGREGGRIVVMTRMMTRWVKNEKGATAIEYALITSLIAVAIIASVTLLGGKISAVFKAIAGKF